MARLGRDTSRLAPKAADGRVRQDGKDRAAVSEKTRMPETLTTRAERDADRDAIDALQRSAFGPGAYARAAWRVREQAPHDPALSFVTERNGCLIGSVRMTPV